MADPVFGSVSPCGDSTPRIQELGGFKEAVCIDSDRIYDSCADKDLIENLPVLFTEPAQHIIDQACSCRVKDVEVLTALVDIEPVPFNRGFYSIDMTFFFDVILDVFLAPAACPVSVSGCCIFSKKVILFGSEGNVKTFTSSTVPCGSPTPREIDLSPLSSLNLPKASVQVAEPIGLDAKICCGIPAAPTNCTQIPEALAQRYGGDFVYPANGNAVYVTIGIFTIVQIGRNVQILVPTYDFRIPRKEAISTTEDPEELFSKLDFPTDQFFPPRVTDEDCRTDKPCPRCQA